MTSAVCPVGRGARVAIAAGRPRQELVAQHELRHTVVQDERAVGELLVHGLVKAVRPRYGLDALAVEPRIDHVGPGHAVEVAPQRGEALVVLAPALRARTVTRREGGRLVEEEQLREPPRSQERGSTPSLELEAACDPAPHLIPPPDVALRIVQAAAVSVDQAPAGGRDELAEGRDTILQRHLDQGNRTAGAPVGTPRRPSRNPTATLPCIA